LKGGGTTLPRRGTGGAGGKRLRRHLLKKSMETQGRTAAFKQLSPERGGGGDNPKKGTWKNGDKKRDLFGARGRGLVPPFLKGTLSPKEGRERSPRWPQKKIWGCKRVRGGAERDSSLPCERRLYARKKKG